MKALILSAVVIMVGLGLSGAKAEDLALSVRLAPEYRTIDNSTAFCGVLELSNASPDSEQFNFPTYVSQGITWEIRHDGSKFEVSESGSLSRVGKCRMVRLGPGEFIAIPFALMRENNRFLFEDNGGYEVRAFVRFGRDQYYSSPWVEFSVRESSYREDWREMFGGLSSIVAFPAAPSADRMLPFLGTQGYDIWLTYLHGGIALTYASESDAPIDGVLDEQLMTSLNALIDKKPADSPARRMWEFIGQPSDIWSCKCYHGGDFALRWLQ